ncbi:hypothetical protein Baya_5483 [Bagarius yarrelli]|uniref:Uncharacterized protein n=1 Tax=Bagarius yarrelli TaxID=175774 RepID=A0A556TUT8_BAGYA|nr:hypothetical protein Baya_5483 [Bagarius yarrelli]
MRQRQKRPLNRRTPPLMEAIDESSQPLVRGGWVLVPSPFFPIRHFTGCYFPSIIQTHNPPPLHQNNAPKQGIRNTK